MRGELAAQTDGLGDCTQAGGVAGRRRAQRLVREDRWPVTQLEVHAEYNHVSAEQIRAAVAPHLGEGFFALNLDDVRAAVAALPWVEPSKRANAGRTRRATRHEHQPFARWGESV